MRAKRKATWEGPGQASQSPGNLPRGTHTGPGPMTVGPAVSVRQESVHGPPATGRGGESSAPLRRGTPGLPAVRANELSYTELRGYISVVPSREKAKGSS